MIERIMTYCVQKTDWRSFRAIKCWATKLNHVYRMDGDDLVVSTAAGHILRYREVAKEKVEEQ